MKMLKVKKGYLLLIIILPAVMMIPIFFANHGAEWKPYPLAEKGTPQDEADKKHRQAGLPWENDPKFLQAVQTHNTPRLLAEFQAILKEPLPGELFNVKLAADMLKGIILKPGEVFSQNSRLGPYTRKKGYQAGPMYVGSRVSEAVGGGVCKIASLLYNVATLTNLEILERHYHSMPVPYVPPGQDATVAYGYKDFKFRNNTSEPILIWAGSVENTVYVAFYGNTIPPKVGWHHETLLETPFQTIYQNDASLPKGTEKILVEGMKGCLVETTLVIEYQDGEVEIRELGRSWYNPMPKLIARGT